MKDLVPRKWRRDADNPLAMFQREMNRLFDSFLGETEGATTQWSPNVDVTENESAVVVKAEVPGLTDKDIDLSLSGDVLTLRGEKKDERKEEKGSYRMVERRYGSFRLSIRRTA